MAIKKQEFYEGAALHLLARSGRIARLTYQPPFFVLNNDYLVLLKYCTKVRSPWGFTFTPDEQASLKQRGADYTTYIGLICGADGIAAVPYDQYRIIAAFRTSALHVSCFRKHREHYEVNGPDGSLERKVAPSDWQKILEGREPI